MFVLSSKFSSVTVEILQTFLGISDDHFVKTASNSDVVMLEFSDTFVDLTWNGSF